MRDRESYGTPYTIGEARLAAADVANVYHRELMQWLVRSVAELAAIINDATANLEAKSDRAHRMHVAKLFRDRMTAVVDADSLERALTCARCDGDGEVSHGSCAVPDCEHMDPCPLCGGNGKRPTDDEIAELRADRDRLAGDQMVLEAELAAYKERDRDRPHPFDDGLAFVLEQWCAWAREPERAALLGGPDHALLTAAAKALARRGVAERLCQAAAEQSDACEACSQDVFDAALNHVTDPAFNAWVRATNRTEDAAAAWRSAQSTAVPATST